MIKNRDCRTKGKSILIWEAGGRDHCSLWPFGISDIVNISGNYTLKKKLVLMYYTLLWEGEYDTGVGGGGSKKM